MIPIYFSIFLILFYNNRVSNPSFTYNLIISKNILFLIYINLLHIPPYKKLFLLKINYYQIYNYFLNSN